MQNNKTHIFLPLVVLEDSVDAINLLQKKTEIKIQQSNECNDAVTSAVWTEQWRNLRVEGKFSGKQEV